MQELTRAQKGALAEAMVTAAAVRQGIDVFRPVQDGSRADLVLDFGHHVDRVQCKWGRLEGDVIAVRTSTCRHSPTRGYIRTVYAADEIEAIAVYCGDLNRCFYLPITVVLGKSYVHLRLSPAKNNQRLGVTMAAEYEFGAIAQLGERLAGSQKVAGSSPASST
jgi:hypothetical protein